MTASPRGIVAAALTSTGFPVVAGRWPDQISKTTLVLALSTVEPGPPQAQLTWGVTVFVLTPLAGEHAEDELEVATVTVVQALAAAEAVNLTGGTRQTVADDAFNAMGLTTEVYTPITIP